MLPVATIRLGLLTLGSSFQYHGRGALAAACLSMAAAVEAPGDVVIHL